MRLLSKRFGSCLHNARPDRLRLVPLLGRVFIEQRALLAPDHTAFPNFRGGEQISSRIWMTSQRISHRNSLNLRVKCRARFRI